MAMGKSNFPKKQSKLHHPMYAMKGMNTPKERFQNKFYNKLKMMTNRITKRRAKRK